MRKTGFKILIAVSFSTVLFADTIYLNDGFDNGNRKVQNLLNSAQWFATHTQTRAAQVIDVAGNYVLAINDYTPSTVRGAVAYFTEPGNKVSLTPENNTLRFSFDFTANARTVGSLDRGLRFIMVDSERRTYRDELGSLKMRGYMVAMNPGTGALWFRTRNDMASNYLTSTSPWDNQLSGQRVMGMRGGVTYNMTIQVERMPDNKVKITATMTDGTSTASGFWIDRDYLQYSFDTIGIGATGTTITGRLDVDNVLVSGK